MIEQALKKIAFISELMFHEVIHVTNIFWSDLTNVAVRYFLNMKKQKKKTAHERALFLY